jgi:hypothetical protein
MNTTHSIAMRWQQWRERRTARRRVGSDGFVGPIVRPVWPVWADPGSLPRRRREPQRVDPLRRPRAQGCGWFDSSLDLRGGLVVLEQEWLDLPSAAELDGQVQFL